MKQSTLFLDLSLDSEFKILTMLKSEKNIPGGRHPTGKRDDHAEDLTISARRKQGKSNIEDSESTKVSGKRQNRPTRPFSGVRVA